VISTSAVSEQQLGKHVPAATDTNATIVERYFLIGPCREVITRTVGATNSVDSELSSAREAVKTEPERMKLKNLHC
jgi:hypothetical protein